MHRYRNIQRLNRIRSGNNYFVWTNENCSWPIDNILWTQFENNRWRFSWNFIAYFRQTVLIVYEFTACQTPNFFNISFEFSITKNNTKIVSFSMQHNCRKICQIISLVHRIISNNRQHCCELWWSEWLHFDWHYG